MSREFGHHLHSSGRCFMYLRWVESRLRDFLCIKCALKQGNMGILEVYEEMQKTGKGSREYTELLMKSGANQSLGQLIRKFLDEWPQLRDDHEVLHAFKVVEIHRNAFSHAYMPSFGGCLLFAPNDHTKKLIKETGFPQDKLKLGETDSPLILVLPCLHRDFVTDFYERIKLIDFACFWKVARELGIRNYPGTLADPDWPLTEGIDPATLAQSSKHP